MNNLAQLVLDRAGRRPPARFGVVEQPITLDEAAATARRGAAQLAAVGLPAGTRAAVIGTTSTSYILAWMALQLAGVEAALVNPALPDDLLGQMLASLRPDGVLWVGQPPRTSLEPNARHVDATDLAHGQLLWEGSPIQTANGETTPAGLSRAPEDIAGYMHTSGSTGAPKFCAQSQRYFLGLGRFIADAMALSPADAVFAPLPMFHINPLGYGMVGGLVGGADVLGATRFSASRFWPAVKENGVTVAFLHAPPVEILKKATTPQDAAGHRLRSVFYADEEFMARFQIPLGYACYGSTEAGGLCHIWTWRLGERCPHPEGMSRYAGLPRHDVEWDLAADGEILVRGRQAHVLCSGYQTPGGLLPLVGADGWFHTGDLGRRDEHGRLIFIERRAESIRVKGEYLPIAFIERTFAEIQALQEVALWRRDSDLVDHEAVLYVVAAGPLPRDELLAQARTLPPFMRPSAVVRIETLPRLTGVGKVNRRQLAAMPVCERLELE